MTIETKNYEFELVRAKKCNNYHAINNSIEKARYIFNHKKGTYEIHNGGYLIQEYTYIVIDTENGFILNNNPLTYTNCETLIKMYL